MLKLKGVSGDHHLVHYLQLIGSGTIPFDNVRVQKICLSTELSADTYPLSRMLSFLFLPFFCKEIAYLTLGDHQLQSWILPITRANSI